MSDSGSGVVEQWLALDPNAESRQVVLDLLKSDPAGAEKLMSPRIAFGTAGLRAEMGPGFSRMNAVTVLQASQGLAVYVADNVENALKRGIVVGHDHRHYSQEFAELTALAFAHKGFKVHYLGLVHTPSVPFAINKFKAACGVMVTASHNPAKDNGYKVYWANGCQIIPPHDEGIAQAILDNLTPWTWDVSAVKDIVATPVSVFDAYFQDFDKIVFETINDAPKFVYTPMHGVGLPYAEKAISLLGLSKNMIVVKEQAQPDPNFPTVRFPNPEEKGALDLAMKYGDENGARIILSNDPDADRFAAAIKTESGWRQLKGDEVGTLLADFLIQKYQAAGEDKLAVLNSTVSSQVLHHLADFYKIRYEETLTGFKWLGNKSIDLTEEGYKVALAYEEALGYMCGSIFDKDGVSALFVFVQFLLSLDTTVEDRLEKIYSKVGYFAQHNSYYKVPDPSMTTGVFAKIRASGIPKTIGPLKVLAWRDLTTGYDSEQADHVPLLPVSPSAEMITCLVESSTGTARFTARGSGTEPKIKVYVEARANSEKEAGLLADHVWDVLGKEWFQGLAAEE